MDLIKRSDRLQISFGKSRNKIPIWQKLQPILQQIFHNVVVEITVVVIVNYLI